MDIINNPLTEYCKDNGFKQLFEYNKNIITRYEKNGVTYIGGKYDTSIHMLEEELNIEVPFNVGDKVRHMYTRHTYIVYALPYLDRRIYGHLELQGKYTAGEINHLVQYGNILWVQDEDGIVEPEGLGKHPLSDIEAYYKNFELI